MGRHAALHPYRTLSALALGLGCTAATLPSLGTAAAAAPPPAAAPVEFAMDDPAFYDTPDPIPAGNHGELLRFQAIDTAFEDSWRIMYLSTTVSGAPTVVTGLVAAPDDRPPFGGFNVLLHGHGTIGVADKCAPSRVLETADDEYAYDFESAANATNQGWAVVSTDFEGLGGPGRHPYLVGISEGRSMLDAGLAARQLPGLYLSDVTGIVGFSQGGHAALWAAQLAPEWTPQQPIIGTVLGAASSEVVEFARAGVNDPAAAALTVSMIGGLAAAYPEAEAAIGSVLSPAGLELLTLMDEHCFDEPVAMPQGALVAADPTAVEPFASLLAANTAGTVAMATPILAFHGDADQNVPLVTSDTMTARLCAAGQVIERRILPGGYHAAAAAAAYNDGTTWLTGLAAGTGAATSTC
ncbi:lipase family protein [Desertimonas flava]|uniref:lipase family protein n=1 Tax=Desertimonas flava TaxID=2064846 RepID=UPI0013C481AC|nr:lipase family protein [Desertimonas flava]